MGPTPSAIGTGLAIGFFMGNSFELHPSNQSKRNRGKSNIFYNITYERNISH